MKDKTKKLNCKECGETVNNVGHDAEKVTCSKCVTKSMASGIDIYNDDEDDANDNL